MDSTELIKQVIATKKKTNLCFSGKSMYPTLKDSMMLTLVNISPAAIKTSDIIAYQQNNAIVTHRVIDIIPNKGGIVFITKGDNRPFGGISQVEQKDLIARVEGAFYANQPQKDILIKNRCYCLSYVFLGRLYLFYRRSIKRHLPKVLRMFLRSFVKGFYLIFKRFTIVMANYLW